MEAFLWSVFFSASREFFAELLHTLVSPTLASGKPVFVFGSYGPRSSVSISAHSAEWSAIVSLASACVVVHVRALLLEALETLSPPPPQFRQFS